MAKIARYEFIGNWLNLLACFVTGVGVPIAILYLVNGTIRIEEEIDDRSDSLPDTRPCSVSISGTTAATWICSSMEPTDSVKSMRAMSVIARTTSLWSTENPCFVTLTL
jgi:hypothetical protein